MTRLRLGTRGSPLALWQAEWTKTSLQKAHPRVEVEIVIVESHGDIDLKTSLSQMGTIGIFTQTLENELRAGKVDVAVHSLKDVPAQLLSDELALVAFSPREDPRDAWFHREGIALADTPRGTVVATSSLRRQCQLRAMRPDLEVVPLRGNLGTRWRKFEEGQFDAMILAAAGVHRLGWDERVTERIDPSRLLPAVGQGIVGLECRVDSEAASLVSAISDEESAIAARTERSLLETVAGGCVVPLAGFCVRDGDQLWLRGRLGEPDGSLVREAEARGDDPVDLGRQVARELLADGGEDIVRRAKSGPKK